ncbi:hypothetical protein ADUPG1_011766, partial [Aduncisulcus paluster]
MNRPEETVRRKLETIDRFTLALSKQEQEIETHQDMLEYSHSQFQLSKQMKIYRDSISSVLHTDKIGQDLGETVEDGIELFYSSLSRDYTKKDLEDSKLSIIGEMPSKIHDYTISVPKANLDFPIPSFSREESKGRYLDLNDLFTEFNTLKHIICADKILKNAVTEQLDARIERVKSKSSFHFSVHNEALINSKKILSSEKMSLFTFSSYFYRIDWLLPILNLGNISNLRKKSKQSKKSDQISLSPLEETILNTYPDLIESSFKAVHSLCLYLLSFSLKLHPKLSICQEVLEKWVIIHHREIESQRKEEEEAKGLTSSSSSFSHPSLFFPSFCPFCDRQFKSYTLFSHHLSGKKCVKCREKIKSE